jgi:prolipoprotein diacylglyceryltransferase
MQQVLFHLPLTQNWFGMPDGIPLYGFGAMLFLCFVLTAMVWGPRRVEQIGLPRERMQDLAIALFLSGIAGARVVYILQYPDQFRADNLADRLGKYVNITTGGIVFYGSVIGGVAGFLLFHRLVLRKYRISTWKLADAVAPLIALGLAVGRIGCYLNGCCWGQVACPECQPVPLTASLGEFPLLPAHARDQVVRPASEADRLPNIRGLQTSTGFSVKPFDPAVVAAVEPGSAAAAAGLEPGDRVVEVNTRPNPTEKGLDTLHETVGSWPRGEKRLDLVVERGGQTVPVSFVPRTLTFFPTQLYETVSMILLIGVLLTFQPFRRHDGQVMVVLMAGYAVHRFFNEAIRIEPTYALGLTLSQWISVVILLAAVGLEVFLRKTQTPLPPGPQPLRYGAPPVPVPTPAAA